MTYRGHVENGQVVLDESASLPEGVLVRIEIVAPEATIEIHPDVKRISGLIPEDVKLEDRHLGLAKKHQ